MPDLNIDKTLEGLGIPEYPYTAALTTLLSMAKTKGKIKVKFDPKKYD